MILKIILVCTGLALFTMGSFAFFLPRRKMLHWAIEAREQLIERYKNMGDEKMALGLSREIAALEVPPPFYSKVFIGIGALLLIASYLFSQ